MCRLYLGCIPADADTTFLYMGIIPTHCFYCFFGDFDWSVGKIKSFLHFDKNPCVGIFDNCLDFTVLDCADNNELYRTLNNFTRLNIVKYVLKLKQGFTPS